jgi:hypothetical protein
MTGGASVASGATVTPPAANQRMLEETLRKFVTAKVFPNWKFIFKKERLGLCGILAISKSHITAPPGFEENQLAELQSHAVQSSLDGCRANVCGGPGQGKYT